MHMAEVLLDSQGKGQHPQPRGVQAEAACLGCTAGLELELVLPVLRASTSIPTGALPAPSPRPICSLRLRCANCSGSASTELQERGSATALSCEVQHNMAKNIP